MARGENTKTLTEQAASIADKVRIECDGTHELERSTLGLITEVKAMRLRSIPSTT